MMRVLISEWMKTKRTSIRWLAFSTPIIFSLFTTWYFSLKTVNPNRQILLLNAFEVWTALVIPLSVGLMSGLMIHQEELAGDFRNFLGSSLPRQALYLGKLMMLIILVSTSTLIALLVFSVGQYFILNVHIFLPIFIIAIIMAIIATFPLLTLHLWISFAWGIGASIAIGAGGSLIAALMATGLGDKIWLYVPWAWSVRLLELSGVYLYTMKYQTGNISYNFLAKQLIDGLIIVLVCFIGLLACSLIWFKKWEGRKITD